MAAITQSIDMTVEQAKNLVIGVLRDEKTGSEDVENARFVRDMLEGLQYCTVPETFPGGSHSFFDTLRALNIIYKDHVQRDPASVERLPFDGMCGSFFSTRQLKSALGPVVAKRHQNDTHSANGCVVC